MVSCGILRWFYRVGCCCVVLQRHYGSGSHITVTFSVRYSLFFSFLFSVVPDYGYKRWRKLSAVAPVEWSHPCRHSNPTGHYCLLETCCVAWVDVPIRSDWVVWVKLCSARVDVPIQPAGVVVVCSFLFSWSWPPKTIYLYFFCYINRNVLVECCSSIKKLWNLPFEF